MLKLWRLLGHQRGTRGAPHQKGTRGAPRSSHEASKRLPCGSLEVLRELFEVQEAPRNVPRPPSSIHASFSEPPRDTPGGPSRDLSALPRDYERRDALERAAESRSIGPVDVPELQSAQNSNSGGVEAAILDTFIVFEPPRAPLGPLHFDPPGIPTKRHARVLTPFLSKNAFSPRRELDFRFARKTTSPKTD